MKISKTILSMCLGVLFLLGSSGAQATNGIGTGDPFTLHFDENGNGMIDFRDGTGNHPDLGFAAIDPNTGVNALTYRLSGTVGAGIGDIFDSTGALSDAISFYNLDGVGFMAFYSTLPGNDLADLISGGFVPGGVNIATEVGDNFAYFSGGEPGANNDYYGVSAGVPDSGSTVVLLGVAMIVVVLLHRRIVAKRA